MKLSREIRCFPNEIASRREGGDVFWTIRAVVEGPVDARTGYVFDIKRIDRLVQDCVVPEIVNRMESDELPGALVRAFRPCAAEVPAPAALAALDLYVSPYLCFTVRQDAPDMIRLTKTYEFCAAHRLFCSDFSDEENRRIFGRCSNPNWHGHNYTLEVTIAGIPEGRTGSLIEDGRLDDVVNERVLDVFDHKNLNVECPEFAQINPSVENIARVIYKRLHGQFDRAELASVKVWETSKTSAECTEEGRTTS